MRVVLALVLLGVSATAVLGGYEEAAYGHVGGKNNFYSQPNPWGDDDDDNGAPVVVAPIEVAPCGRRMSSRRSGFRRSLSQKVKTCLFVSATRVNEVAKNIFSPSEYYAIYEGAAEFTQEQKAKLMNAMYQKTLKNVEDTPILGAVVEHMGVMNPLGAVVRYKRDTKKTGTVFDMMLSKDKATDRFKFCLQVDLTKNPGGKFLKDAIGEGSLSITHDVDAGITRGDVTAECANCIMGKMKAVIGLARFGRNATNVSKDSAGVPAYSKETSFKDRCIDDANCGVADNDYMKGLARRGKARMNKADADEGMSLLGKKFNRIVGETQNSVGLLGTRAGIKGSFTGSFIYDANWDKAPCDDYCAAAGGEAYEKHISDVGSIAVELKIQLAAEATILGNEHILATGANVKGKYNFDGTWEASANAFASHSHNGHISKLEYGVAIGGGDGAGVGVTVSANIGESTQDVHWKKVFKNDAVGVRKGRNAGPRSNRQPELEKYMDEEGTLRHSVQSCMYCVSEMDPNDDSVAVLLILTRLDGCGRHSYRLLQA